MDGNSSGLYDWMRRYKRAIMVAFWCIICTLWIVFSLVVITTINPQESSKFVTDNFLALVGAPTCATVAFVVVTAFTQTEGPVRFKGLGFELEGAAGPVVLWVLCFLATVGGVKVLWG